MIWGAEEKLFVPREENSGGPSEFSPGKGPSKNNFHAKEPLKFPQGLPPCN